MKILPRRGELQDSFSDLAVFAVKFFFAAKQSGEIPASQFFRRIAQQPAKGCIARHEFPVKISTEESLLRGFSAGTQAPG